MISVIVPVYNVEQYLDQCVESIVKQTYKQLEIILIDDGSTDASGLLCDKWGEKDSRISVLHQSNQGLCAARNVGLNHAGGEYIAFVDSDDYIHPKMYELLLRAMQKNNADITACRERAFEDGSEQVEEVLCRNSIVTAENQQQYLNHFLEDFIGPYTWVWNKLYTREIIGEKRFGKEWVLEDIFFSVDLAVGAGRVAWIEEQLYYYRQHPSSIMHRNRENMLLLAYKNAYLHLYERIAESKLEELQNKNLCKCLNRLANLETEAFKMKENEIRTEIRESFIKLYDNKYVVRDGRERLKLFLARRFFYLYYLLKVMCIDRSK